MERRKTRLTLGRLMAAIGIVALGLAMTRLDAAPAVSVCVFVGCTWYLAHRRYDEGLARHGTEDGPIDGRQKVRLAVRCVAGAALAIGLPDAAFLGGYYGYMGVVGSLVAQGRWSPDLEPEHILWGALIGTIAALSVASIMGRGSRAAAKGRLRMPSDQAAARGFAEDGPIAFRRVPA